MAHFYDYTEQLYLKEVNFLSTLQEKLAGVEDFIVPVSAIGDPSKGFTVYFPLLLSLHYLKGIKFLGAFIICEWVNMVRCRRASEQMADVECCCSGRQVVTARRATLLVGGRERTEYHTGPD